ncbi:hypothetical protein [Marinospirillum alkaliphilum]|uniref:Uncharacterized protein n=1 Tax=Marinospirillum alkaliphilum DSM 21637 TaxID=1122209 RepID=A0A1K1XZF0_9GAMM|nr:hypothetical protein [Marinospirillum alkaliphilum]SFX54992.1 hypothetical protein SAMN02745752_02040 [Marinospirillum alkaliphilum DSM 21637]
MLHPKPDLPCHEQGFLLVPLLALMAAALLLIQMATTSLSQSARIHASQMEGERLHKQALLIIRRVEQDLRNNSANAYTQAHQSLNNPGQHGVMQTGCTASRSLQQLPAFSRLNREGCLQLYRLQPGSNPDHLLTLELRGEQGTRARWQVVFQANSEGQQTARLMRDCLGAQRSSCQ